MTPAERQRDEDAAFFADWSCGRDAGGLWLWASPVWRAIVVRDFGDAAMAGLLRNMGARRQVWHRYDCDPDRDWLVPAERWRRLRAALPAMRALRRRWLERRLRRRAAAAR